MSQELVFLDPEHLDCVLAGGDAADLPGLRLWCATLPPESYGRIFIEVFSPIQIEPLNPPPGIGVTWICREQLRPSPRPGIGIPRGQALADAVDAWLDEWLRADPASGRHFTVWTGARTSSIMHSFWRRIESELTRIWSGERTPPAGA
ncbi:hypothetical protein J4H92_01820 [Leucobacter weissii]|uniref:Siderophore-interacting protein C-terminal domain-containing protein n=2 Tax=Leucobacter weissii TaxID=1983706 RepID=A0A939MH92_9MICO|nr:hypothetical protein [Leucobacter weissii]MBO1900683.1 hypothetical protein [Leucobacter weissii]